jgi:hypothetical protein
MLGRKDHQAKPFTSFQLSQYVPQDNFYSRWKELPDLHWLYKATEKYCGSERQKSIGPEVFLS